MQLIVDDPVHTIENNINSTQTVLEEAVKYGKSVLLASTSELYGLSENLPFSEDSEVVYGPTSRFRWTASTRPTPPGRSGTLRSCWANSDVGRTVWSAVFLVNVFLFFHVLAGGRRLVDACWPRLCVHSVARRDAR